METALSWLSDRSWIVVAFAIVFGSLLLRVILKYVFDHLERATSGTENVYDDAFIHVARKPIGWAILIFGVLLAATVIRDNTDTGLLQYIPEVREVSIIVLLAWFSSRFINAVSEAIKLKQDSGEDQVTVDAIAKLIRVSVLITGFLIVLQTLGFSIEGVLAFGGIGGIAIGFAAREMLANFFGSISLLMDKPFAVGDWIRSNQIEIEGTVEDIGWRVTRIRTFDKRPLYVPNSTFTNLTVENPSRMTNRRIYETMGLRYDDVSVVPRVLEDVRNMLKNHEEIDTNQTLMVNLNEFNDSSMDFFVYTFTKTTNWERFHEIKEDVLLKISQIVQSHGAEMAFPTQTIHLNPEEIAHAQS